MRFVSIEPKGYQRHQHRETAATIVYCVILMNHAAMTGP
jgi:hypothetical protein